MGKEVTIVTYKPQQNPSQGNPGEFMCVVNPTEYKKYKDGDTSIALALIVDSFNVFHSSTGHTGRWGQASEGQLETVFNTSREEDVVKQILDKGEAKSSDRFNINTADTNASRGSGNVRTGAGGGR